MVEKIQATQVREIFETSSNQILKSNDQEALSFGDLLKDSIQGVNQSQFEADATIGAFMKGEVQDVHRVMIALQKAEMNLKMAMQFRNKLVSAYEEIMRMQV